MFNRIPISFTFPLKIAGWIILNLFMVFFVHLYVENVFLNNLLVGLNFFLSASILVSIGRYVILTLYANSRKYKIRSSFRSNFVLGINRLSAILNALFALNMIMIIIGVDPREFLTSITLVAMAIAVLFRDYITNMISGLILMFSDQLAIGDHVIIDKQEGRVEDITLSNIVVRNGSGELVLLPNNLFFTSSVVNKTSGKSQTLVLEFELLPQYLNDLDILEEDLNSFCQKHPKLTPGTKIELAIDKISWEYVRIKIALNLPSSSNNLRKEIKSALFKEIILFQQKQ